MNNVQAVHDALAHGADPKEVALKLAAALDSSRDAYRQDARRISTESLMAQRYARLIDALVAIGEQVDDVSELLGYAAAEDDEE